MYGLPQGARNDVIHGRQGQITVVPSVGSNANMFAGGPAPVYSMVDDAAKLQLSTGGGPLSGPHQSFPVHASVPELQDNVSTHASVEEQNALFEKLSSRVPLRHAIGFRGKKRGRSSWRFEDSSMSMMLRDSTPSLQWEAVLDTHFIPRDSMLRFYFATLRTQYMCWSDSTWGRMYPHSRALYGSTRVFPSVEDGSGIRRLQRVASIDKRRRLLLDSLSRSGGEGALHANVLLIRDKLKQFSYSWHMNDVTKFPPYGSDMYACFSPFIRHPLAAYVSADEAVRRPGELPLPGRAGGTDFTDLSQQRGGLEDSLTFVKQCLISLSEASGYGRSMLLNPLLVIPVREYNSKACIMALVVKYVSVWIVWKARQLAEEERNYNNASPDATGGNLPPVHVALRHIIAARYAMTI